MIGKTSIGRSFKGCCGYNMEKVEKGKGEVILSQGVRDYEQKAMVADFVRQAQLNPDLSRSVWHTAISFDPQDEVRVRANPQLIQSVASDYLKGMGLDQSQYAVIEHRDTGHSHFHIIANRVANDGQTISDSHNFSRSEHLLRQIEQKYALTPMMEQTQRKSLENLPERDRSRIEIRDQVRESLSRSTNGEDLRQQLSQQGIRILINRDSAGQPRGVTFERTIQDEQGEAVTHAFKGSKLHQSLGIHQISQQLTLNQQQRERLAQQEAHKLAQEQRTAQKQSSLDNEEKTPEIKPKRGQGRSR
ncbi:relaxase/mobilization nuclease domain-containing protein [Spirosoma flavum]|uniref:Relaxase/mobilization nuclease domain-containing protein n=1 Tax=Spirosoma flavum TaxID=2048557 RepID=A0ABW6AWB1_9BACT